MSTAYDMRDEQLVDDLLSETAETDSAGLRMVLLELRSLANGPAPEPSAELAALLNPDIVTLDSRRRRKPRPILVSLAVIAAMSLGVGAAAAASPEFRSAAQHAISTAVSAISTAIHAPTRPQTPANPRSTSSRPLVSPSPLPSANPRIPILPTIPARPEPSASARPANPGQPPTHTLPPQAQRNTASPPGTVAREYQSRTMREPATNSPPAATSNPN